MGIRELLKQKHNCETKAFSVKLKVETIEKINEIANNVNMKKADVIDNAIDDAYLLFKKIFKESKNKSTNKKFIDNNIDSRA